MGTENNEVDIEFLVNSIDRGNNDQVIEIIDKLENPSEELLLYKTDALNYKGEYKAALNILKSLNKSEDDWIKIQALIQISRNYWMSDENETAHKFILQAEQLLCELEIQSQNQKKIKAKLLHMSGSIAWFQNDFLQGRKLLEESLEMSKELEDKASIASTLANLSIIQQTMGELQKSLDSQLQVKKIFEELGNKEGTGVILWGIAYSYNYLRETELALEFIQKSYDILKTLPNPYRVAQALSGLIFINLSLGSINQANKYYQELTLLSNQNKIKTIQSMEKFSKVLILRKSKRGRDQYKAQEILFDLLNDAEQGFDFLIAYYLCDSLLQELDHFESDEVLVEVSDLTTEIYVRAQDQGLVVWIIRALILRAKFILITKTDYVTSEKLLDQALALAKENELILLKSTIEDERNKLQADFEKWEELLKSGSTIRERIKHTKIQEYLDDALSKLKHVNI